MRSVLAPFRRQSLRLRITVAFALMAMLLAIVLALTTFLTVRSFLESQRIRSTTRQTVFVLIFAREFYSRDDADPEGLVASLQTRGGFDALVTTPADWFATSLSLTPAGVPTGLRDMVAGERLAYQFTTVDSQRKLAFGAPLQAPGTDLFLFYPLDDIDRTHSIVLRVLVFAAVAVVAVAVIAAQRVARALLRPLGDVSAAAQRVAEGLLETRVATESGDEVGSLAASFNEMAAALQEMLERERRFVANVSHELRTPLSTLRTASELLAGHRESLPPVAREAAGLINEDVVNLSRLVEELMEVSAVDARKAPIRWEPVDLRALVTAVAARLHHDVPVEGDGVTTVADKARVERIVSNLLDNAFQHAGDAAVRAGVRIEGGDAVVTVTDRGRGIAPEDLPRIFDRFYKADSSRARDRGGIGLGLAIAAENARLLGGTLTARNRAEGGAEFTLRLPVRDAPPEDEG